MPLNRSTLPPPTPAQVDYARLISRKLNEAVPWDDVNDRQSLSNWIGARQSAFRKTSHQGPGATSRQVAYAEKIARRKRREIPDECFRDSGLMSRWIDGNR